MACSPPRPPCEARRTTCSSSATTRSKNPSQALQDAADACAACFHLVEQAQNDYTTIAGARFSNGILV
ncbi:MAG: hypothetical protein ABW156_13885, partial [Jiangellaceae bacterium]